MKMNVFPCFLDILLCSKEKEKSQVWNFMILYKIIFGWTVFKTHLDMKMFCTITLSLEFDVALIHHNPLTKMNNIQFPPVSVVWMSSIMFQRSSNSALSQSALCSCKRVCTQARLLIGSGRSGVSTCVARKGKHQAWNEVWRLPSHWTEQSSIITAFLIRGWKTRKVASNLMVNENKGIMA